MIEKLLQVCRFPSGKKYTTGINIKGEYLKKYGFNVGDMVKVEVKNNQIVISKNKATEILTDMQTKSPHITKLIEALDLQIA